MMPYIYFPSDSQDPLEKQRIESGLPPSRLEVQQSLLEHKQQGYRDQVIRNRSLRLDRPVFFRVNKPFERSRRMLGQMLISVGQRLAPGTA